MNLRKLETFYWAAKLGSFTAAAKRLNSTQSTVSMRIQELEREFAVALFDRSRRAARVTQVGRELMQYAEQLLRISAEMRERIGSAETMPGTLRIGVAEVISITWLPRLVSEIHAHYPKVHVELEEALTRDLEDKLENGKLDLILAPGEVPGYKFNPISLGTVQFVWMASPSLGLPEGKIIPQELQNWPVIALSQESFHHRSIEDWFRSGDARCGRIDTCKSLGVAASLAASGLGVTLLPITCFQKELSSGRLMVIDAVPAFSPIKFMATFARNSFTNLAQRIARFAQQISDFDDAPRDDANRQEEALTQV
ncbi:HTH-type transcriptional regulator CatM [bacterium MnTg04]|nr:HTH-type transcriptional regulator CatM [bacterium MnTg04]